MGDKAAPCFSMLFEGQRALIFAPDPLVRGWNLFGTADRGVNFTLVTAQRRRWWALAPLTLAVLTLG